MPNGDLITGVNEAQIGNLLIGIGMPRGTPYIIHSITGLGLPELKTNDSDRANQHGETAGEDRMQKREITIVMSALDDFVANSLGGIMNNLAAELGVLQTNFIEFAYWLPGQQKRLVHCRVRKMDQVIDELWRKGINKDFPIQFYCPDPRLYSADENTEVLTIATAGTVIQETITNAGRVSTPFVVTIDGPARNPRITNDTVGKGIRIDLDVQAGQTLVVDAEQKTVFLNGVNRYDAVRTDNEWWELEFGDNLVTYSRDGGGLTGSPSEATFVYRDAWHF